MTTSIWDICDCSNSAKNYGDYLIVAVQDGDYIKKYKPDAKVLYTTAERWKCLNHCGSLTKWWCMNLLILIFLGTIDFDILALGEDHRWWTF